MFNKHAKNFFIDGLKVSDGNILKGGRVIVSIILTLFLSLTFLFSSNAFDHGDDPYLKRVGIPTLDQDFEDDSIVVILKHKYSSLKNEIPAKAFETKKIGLSDALKAKYNIRTTIFDKLLYKRSKEFEIIDIINQMNVTEAALANKLVNIEGYHQILLIKLNMRSKQKVLDAIVELEKIDIVFVAEPVYNFVYKPH